jgi:proline racemase
MSYKRLIVTADSHTHGEPTRLVIGGVVHYPGNTMREKQAFVARELDMVRKSLMGEPRGHHDMFGGFITPPTSETGDLGIVFIDNQGYLNMCGHGTIGLCMSVVELGIIPPSPPRTEINIDTPAGLVRGYAVSENGHVTRSGFHNVPSFCLSVDTTLQVDGMGTITVGIAYGGNFFVILPADEVGLSLDLDNQPEIRKMGIAIKRAANEQLTIQHPKDSSITGCDIVTFYGPANHPEATYKNVHVFADGQVDRSPGGTGTSAVLAYRLAKGDSDSDSVTVVEGFAGGLFEGRVVKAWDDDGVQYIIPDISGRAYMTGVHTFYLDPSDPMLQGF